VCVWDRERGGGGVSEEEGGGQGALAGAPPATLTHPSTPNTAPHANPSPPLTAMPCITA
jgi:hypothetical protein